METVELYPTHGWDCPECGAQNFELGVVVEGDDEEIQRIKLDLGYEPWDEGILMKGPTEVECVDCHRQFKTIAYGEDHEE